MVTISSGYTISAGVSSFNAETTLATALECVAGQEWPDLQIVIVDDGSTDSSPGLIREFAQNDPRVVAVLLPANSGIPTVRNTIVAHSRGEFVGFFDDDDVSDPKRLNRQACAIKQHESAHPDCTGLVACNVSLSVTFPGGRAEHRTAIGAADFPRRVDTEAVLDHALRYLGDTRGERLQGTGSMMLRRSTIERLGGFDETLRRSSDVDLLIRLVRAGGCVIGVPDRLVHQIITVSADKTSTQAIDSRLALLHKHNDLVMSSRELRGIHLWILMLYAARDGRYFLAFFRLNLALLRCPIFTTLRIRRQLIPRVLVRAFGSRCRHS